MLVGAGLSLLFDFLQLLSYHAMQRVVWPFFGYVLLQTYLANAIFVNVSRLSTEEKFDED
jgi:hypothetical protein